MLLRQVNHLRRTTSSLSQLYCISILREGVTTHHPIQHQREAASTTYKSSSSSESSDDDYSPRQEQSTYINEEVDKFRSIADSWWDINGDCRPLHSLNKLRVNLIREGLMQSGVAKAEHVAGPQPLSGLRVLDVGCGGGILCEPLARLGATVVGLDAAEENVNVARLHADCDPKVQHKLRYVCGTIEEHVEGTEGMYDAVVASEVLEHVNHPDLFIQTCANIIKPGGSIFLTTLNKTAVAWVGAVAIAEYGLHLLPPGTHDWNKFIPRQELLFLLEKSGFVTRTVLGMRYNPLRNRWSWQSNTAISYAVHAMKET